jgi:protein SCO1/2
MRRVILPWIALTLMGAAPLPDPSVLDQNGASVRLARDVIGGRVAVVHFMFTTCQSFCPLSGSVMSRTQAMLKSTPPQHPYRFVSISIQPESTTPAKLKAWLGRFGAGPNWDAVHIAQPALRRVMTFFGETPTDVMLHSSQMLVLDRQGRIAQRFENMPTPQALSAAVQRAARLK